MGVPEQDRLGPVSRRPGDMSGRELWEYSDPMERAEPFRRQRVGAEVLRYVDNGRRGTKGLRPCFGVLLRIFEGENAVEEWEIITRRVSLVDGRREFVNHG